MIDNIFFIFVRLKRVVVNNIYIILIVLLCLTVFLWFKSDFIFNHDSGYNDIPHEFYQSFFTWNDFNPPGTVESTRFLFNFGYIFPYRILTLLFSHQIAQRIMFYLWTSSAWLGVFFLCRVMRFNKTISFFAGGLYTFNTVTLISIFHYGSGNITHSYIFLPIVIALFVKGINEKRGFFYALLLNSIWLFGFSASYVNPVYAVTVFSFSFSYLLFNLLTAENGKRDFYIKARFFIFCILGFILLNLFWLPNFYLDSRSQIETAFSWINEQSAREKIIRESYEPTRLFNLLGFWALFDSFEDKQPYFEFARYYKKPIILFISYLLPIFVFIVPVFRKRKNGDIVNFWYLMAVISITFIGASKIPQISEYFLSLMEFNNYIATGYRNVLTKFAPILMMSYSILFASSVYFIASRTRSRFFKKSFLSLSFLIFVVVLPLPLWKGAQFRGNQGNAASHHVKIPDYYWQGQQFFEAEKNNDRIAAFPVNTAAHLELKWEQGHTGNIPFSQLLLKPVLGKTAGISYDVFKSIGPLIQGNIDKKVIAKLLSFYNVKYIIFFKDIDWLAAKGRTYSIPDNFEAVEDFFSKDSGPFQHIKDIGKLAIYKIDGEYRLPKFFVSPQIIVTDDDINRFPDILLNSNYRIGLTTYLQKQNYNKWDKFLKNISESIPTFKAGLVKQEQINLPGSSFEEGSWQEKPADCSNTMSGEPNFSMKLSEDATDGRYSLELGSKNHYACVSKTFQVSLQKGKLYHYSFDFKNIEGNKIEFYFSLRGGKQYPFSGLLEVDAHNWNHYETIFRPEEDKTSMDIYFYATSDGERDIVNRIDNIRLFPLDFRLEKQSITVKEIQTPSLEFKRINPIKYRIVVHQAKDNFPLVFSESFHKLWNVYLVKGQEQNSKQVLINKLVDYKILDGNDDDQASGDELLDYISKGWVTTLVDTSSEKKIFSLGDKKEIKHYKFEDGKRKLNYIEKYKIDFISKNFYGTIQNNNLSDGVFYETWFQKPIIGEQNHLTANGFANSWIIDVERICKVNSNFCVKNLDGTYDFELVMEFWPQRLLYGGLFISILILLFCINFIVYRWYRNTARKRNSSSFKNL